jgi:hypothetical protein
MASSSLPYLLPGSSPTIGSKSVFIKQSPPPPIFHPIPHQFQHPYHRPPIPSHIHQHYSKSIPNGDTFHPLTVNSDNNGNTLLTTNNNNNTSSMLTTNNNDDSNTNGGPNNHSLSQSMESINNIGSPDDEVR